jgi:hypothetical protein
LRARKELVSTTAPHPISIKEAGSTTAPHPISIKEAGDYSKSKERKKSIEVWL